MKEYAEEKGFVDRGVLQAPPLNDTSYALAHQSLPILCHDVAVEFQGGILLVTRYQHPAKDTLWVLGGRVLRGLAMEESLRRKVKAECNLELDSIKELGVARTFFATDPFGHGKGTDTLNIFYFAKGRGNLKLDPAHGLPCIITQKQYTPAFRKTLHPYIQDVLDRAMTYSAGQK